MRLSTTVGDSSMNCYSMDMLSSLDGFMRIRQHHDLRRKPGIHWPALTSGKLIGADMTSAGDKVSDITICRLPMVVLSALNALLPVWR